MVFRQYKVLSFSETKRLIGLDDVLCDRLFFQEKLYVFNQEGRRVGRFSISVDDSDEENCRSFLVHVSNKANLNGVQSESTLTGTVRRNLKTVEEIRCESSDVQKTGKQDRKMYLLRETAKYYCSVITAVGELKRKHHSTTPFFKSTGLIGEASNVILMRAIAMRGFEGILCLKGILSNGKKVRNYYVSKLSEQVVNGNRWPVMVIYRNLTNHKKYNLTLTATFTRAGQMVYLFWSNTKNFVHIDPDLEIYGPMVSSDRGVGLQYHWNRDKQLYSLYLDRLVQQEAVYRSYGQDAPALKRIVADFLQYVLLLRPKDIICFAVNYFTPFGHGTIANCTPQKDKPSEKATDVPPTKPADVKD